MAQQDLIVGVVVERRAPSNPWAEDLWFPSAVLAGAPDTPAWTEIERWEGGARYYAGTFTLSFHRTETANYRDNLASGSPKLWVSLRRRDGHPPVEVWAVTADPAEGEALTETGWEIVEAMPMPPVIAEALAEFVAEHHVEREFFKRKRKPVDPEALAIRPPGLGTKGARDG